MADISELGRLLGLKKMTRDVDGNKVQLRDKLRWIQISEFGKYSYKHSFTYDKDWKDVLLTSRSNDMLPDITYLLRKAVAIYQTIETARHSKADAVHSSILSAILRRHTE